MSPAQPDRADVVVVGGGLAGISAALGAADAGASVTLLESRPRLGGLTHSFRRAGLDVDNGQHVLLRCCTSYLALLERLGVRGDVHLQDRLDVPVLRPGRAPTRIRRVGAPAPLHLADALLRYAALPLRDRLRLAPAALALGRVDPTDAATDGESFGGWLRRHGQSPAAVEALWDLVGVATLNARADDASLALAATVFQLGLLTDSAAGDIGWATVPLGRLHGAAASTALTQAGVRVRLRHKATRLIRQRGGWLVRGEPDDLRGGAVVLAVPHPVAARLLPPGAVDLPDGWADRLGTAPIVNVHVVLDRTVTDLPMFATVGTSLQFVFDRTRSSGLGSGQYLAVSHSAADGLVDQPSASLRDLVLRDLRRVLPRVDRAQVRDVFVTRERHATFRAAPGSGAWRPGTRTNEPDLHLAGAWTATGWPATMEGAVRSGAAAVSALLGHTVHPVHNGVAA